MVQVPLKLITTRDACDLLSCHQETLYKWIKDGTITFAVRVGGRWKLRLDGLEQFIQARMV